MLKRLAIFGLGLLAAFALIGASTFMTCKYQKTSQESKGQSQGQNCSCVGTMVPALIQTKESQGQTHKSADSPPCWYVLLAWPEGITVWAVILTLGAIVWQSIETRRSVENSRRAIILQFRPKVIIRRVHLTNTNPVQVELLIQNIGGTIAHIYDSEFVAKINDYRKPGFALFESAKSFGDFDLEAGATRMEAVPMDGPAEKVMPIGLLWYRDDLGIKRSTGIHRQWNAEWLMLSPIKDSDAEYSD